MASAADMTIRRATKQDEHAVLDLLRISMGEDAVAWTPDYWRWKHELNPFGPSAILVAEADGRLVGLRAFMRWTWWSAGAAVPAVRAVDTATHPEFRGQGLFKRLTLRLRDEMEEEGVAFVFNTPNAQSRPGYLKMGWSLVGKPTLWVRPVQPIRLALALRREGLGGEEGSPPPVEATSASEVLARPDIQALVESAAGATSEAYHTKTDLAYLNWRYAAIPGFDYQATVQGRGSDGALAIVRTRQRGALRELRVCDLVVGPSAEAQRNARSLLSKLPGIADVDVVIGMRSPNLPISALMLAGYLPAPNTGPILTAYPLARGDGSDPRRLSDWQPSIGAFELF